MKTKTMRAIFRPQALAVAVALGCTAQAHAVSFNIGDIEGTFDSSLSVGSSWSTAGADKSLIGQSNGGRAQSSTEDDNRLNWKSGDAYSTIFKGIHDLELKYGDSGLFMRGKYWYDSALENDDTDFKKIGNQGRQEAAKSSGYQMLDLFVYHNYNIASEPGNVRVGKQVVSWGESTFIGNSINSINPIDVSAFRRPGSEIKEGLIPVNMIYVSQGLTDKLTAEGFYQLEWDQTAVDNCGTFFSNDVVANGCTNNYTIGSGAQFAPVVPLAAALGQPVQVTNEGLVLPRGPNRYPTNSGQFGVALRWLGDVTEYGLYYENYHARNPVLSTQNAGQSATATALALATTPFAGASPALLLGKGNYFLEYPEDIHLYGASFSTTLPTGTAWAGELSYRPNAPVQLNTTALTTDLLAPLTEGQAAAGQDNNGYKRKPITQVQSTLTQFFDQIWGAQRLTLVGEAAFVHVADLEPTSVLQYGRDSDFGAYGPGSTHGFVTQNSWGYRARAILDYDNAIWGVNLKPNMAWSQDVHGYGPNDEFNQGDKALSIGVDADYRNTYTASLSYTNFFGGNYNTAQDRDFVSLSAGVNF